MHRLNNRVKKLEVGVTGEPFVIMLFDNFNMNSFFKQMDACGITKNRPGKVALFDGHKQHFLDTIDYDPMNKSDFERQLTEHQL